MTSELQAYLPTGSTLYAVLINSAGQIWNTSGTPVFEAYNGANWTDYDIALTEAGAGLYFGNMPAAVAGNYSYVVYERAGASPATTDSINGMGTLSWDGSAEVGLSTIAGRLPSSLTANGNMKSSLVEILTTALTETSGLIAGAFKKFFNVADPTGNVNSLPEFAAGNNGGVFLQGGNMAATTVYFNDESNLDTKLTTLAALAATSLPNTTAGSDGGLFIAGANAATSITTALTANITGNLSGSVGSLATQAKADVNAEVVDALNVDTYAEPGQGAPGATISLAAKINYLFKSWRNKKTQTATTRSIYNDAGDTVDHKATDSDDGTTYMKGEVGSGP